MSMFKRSRLAGGVFFFTLVTNDRRPLFASSRLVADLRNAFRTVRAERSFAIPAIVLLPDHLHMMMRLPDGDDNYSSRIGRIKALFTKALSLETRSELPRTSSRVRHRESGVWQQRFWEHTIRDEDDFNRHVEYIHFNPVRHGLVKCPHDWPRSSFHRWVRNGAVAANWGCSCGGHDALWPDDEALAKLCGE